MQIGDRSFEDLTRGLHTKSDKIRTLGRAGAATGDIARFLGIRYQFARNVLVAADIRGTRSGEDRDDSPPAADLWLTVSPEGSLTIPAACLQHSGIRPGESVLVAGGADGVEILSQTAALARAQSILRRFLPADVSLVDELIAERRAEAAGDRGAPA